jgi:hypothetical protein
MYTPQHVFTLCAVTSAHFLLMWQLPKEIFSKYYPEASYLDEITTVTSVRYMGFVLQVGGWVLARPWAWNVWGSVGQGFLARCGAMESVDGVIYVVLEVFDQIPVEREAGATGIVVTSEQRDCTPLSTPEVLHIEELCMVPLHLAVREPSTDWCFTMLK